MMKIKITILCGFLFGMLWSPMVLAAGSRADSNLPDAEQVRAANRYLMQAVQQLQAVPVQDTFSVVIEQEFKRPFWAIWTSNPKVRMIVPVRAAYGFPMSLRKRDMDIRLDHDTKQLVLQTLPPTVLRTSILWDKVNVFRVDAADEKKVTDKQRHAMANAVVDAAEKKAALRVVSKEVREQCSEFLKTWYAGLFEQTAPGQLSRDQVVVYYCDE